MHLVGQILNLFNHCNTNQNIFQSDLEDNSNRAFNERKLNLFIYLFRVRIAFKHRKRIRLAKPFTNAHANKEQNLH